MLQNVLASWGGQLVFVIAGFIMPRMIDRHVGQTALGVWDFAWSLVAYFSLVQGGVVSSVNRFVARFRAANDMQGLNRAVSSVTVILLAMGLTVVVLSIAASLAVPQLLGEQLKDHVADAKWVVVLLGLGVSIQIALSGYGGVLTGCHRWDLHHAINGGGYALTVVAMVVVLQLGCGLPGLALVYLCGDACGRFARLVVAYRVCPGLSVRLSSARWKNACEMLTFGGKSFVTRVAELLMNPAISILIVSFMGPASLALYTRPRSLIRHARTFVTRFALVLTPTASSYQAMHRKRELGDLLVKATMFGAFISFPMMAALAILGGPLLHLWMGPRYAHGSLILALVLGHLGLLFQLPIACVLAGLNAHGRSGLANLAASLCSVSLAAVGLAKWKLSLTTVALVVGTPITVANACYVPLYACRQLRVPFSRFIVKGLCKPLLCCLPFCLCLLGVRALFSTSPARALLYGGVVGGPLLALTYWRWALPHHMRRGIADALLLRKRSALG